jgi:hypothetical protein
MSRTRDKESSPSVTYNEQLRQWIVQPLVKQQSVKEVAPDAERVEHVGVLWNERARQYVVQPMTRHPIGASCDYGPASVIPDAEFEASITAAVLDNLSKYHKQAYDKDLVPKRSDNKQRAFLKAHLSVSVTRYPTGDIWIYPMRRNKGGYSGIGEKIIVPAAEVEERLVTAVREAFSKSS